MRGSTVKKGNKWYISVFLGLDENGKKKYKWYSGYDSKKQAEADLPNKLREAQIGIALAQKETVASLVNIWADDKATQVRPNTMRTYSWVIRQHIIPHLGKIDVTKLEPRHVQAFYNKMRSGDKPVSNRTVQQAHVILHEAFDRALKWGLVSRNVIEAVDRPRAERRKSSVWTFEEAVEFLSINREPEPRFWIGFFLAIMTGMRKGEILALRWSDVDFKSRIAQIQQTLTWVKGSPIFQEPKTERSRRAVALPDEVLEELKQYRSLHAQSRLLQGDQYQDHGLVICRIDGRPMNPRTFDDAWCRSLERAKLPKIRFHDLRHTHASVLLRQGVHPKIVSERLGHSNINITLDTYSHVLPGMQQDVANQLGAMYSAASNQPSNPTSNLISNPMSRGESGTIRNVDKKASKSSI